MTEDYETKNEKNIELNQNIIGLNTIINTMKEKQNSLEREILIKTNQVTEYDSRVQKAQDELDLIQYKLQEQMKELTHLTLKTDTLTSTNDGLMSERDHMKMELKETRELAKSYEGKSTELME